MRIITGTARGCRLKTPKGQATRPTADRVKESLFNILGTKVYGRAVLDMFAGTGNLGLEALSRGAKQGVFIDKATAKLIEENAQLTRLTAQVTVYGTDVFFKLNQLASAQKSFDLIFCDPPYHKGLWEKALLAIDEFDGLLTHNGILVVEHGADENEIPATSRLVLVMNRRYGHTTQLSFFQRRDFVEGDS